MRAVPNLTGGEPGQCRFSASVFKALSGTSGTLSGTPGNRGQSQAKISPGHIRCILLGLFYFDIRQWRRCMLRKYLLLLRFDIARQRRYCIENVMVLSMRTIVWLPVFF